MGEFPEFQEDEYAVLFAEKNTGIVVDQNGERYNHKPHQLQYTILSSYEEAENMIKLRMLRYPALEGSIFNSRNKCIKMF